MAKMIVIGGGPAGVTAALRARELGAEVTLVERGRLGGTCTNDGCAPTRVLAKAARLLRDAQQFEDYGLQAAPPELDFSRLMERTQHVIYQMQEKKQLIHRLEDAGVKVIANAGTARFEDAHTISLADGRRLLADQFILCAGGRARRLDFPGADLAFTHSDVWSLKKTASLGGGRRGSRHGLPARVHLQGIWHRGHPARSGSAHPGAGG